jgi:hypothetical protein
MYPPYLRVYLADSKGGIMYNRKICMMVGVRKTIKECFKKFNKVMKFGKIDNFILYFRRVGEKWS